MFQVIYIITKCGAITMLHQVKHVSPGLLYAMRMRETNAPNVIHVESFGVPRQSEQHTGP